MNARQIEVCAARLPPDERRRFITMMAGARALNLQAAELRREAWALYRAATGRPKRDAANGAKTVAAAQDSSGSANRSGNGRLRASARGMGG